MKKLLCVIPSLGGGGAERVFVHLLRHLDRTKFLPKVVLFEKKGELLGELPSDIGVIELKEGENVTQGYGTVFFKLTRRLAAVIQRERPDVILSFMWYTNFVTLLGRMVSRVPCRVVISERYSLSSSFEGFFTEFLRRTVIRLFYGRADGIIVNSREMGRQLMKMRSRLGRKLSVIYNPVDIERIKKLAKERADHHWFREGVPVIIGIGRLSRQKGFDHLIRAVGIAARRGIACRLVILGTGTEEDNLKQLASGLGIADKVQVLGYQKNPYAYLSRSTVFVLSSLYEGFPNALLEAMALGIPSVAARCPTGPEELVTDGADGLLVPPGDARALADAIERLLHKSALRARIAEAAKARSRDFTINGIVRQYEDVLMGSCAASAKN